MFNELDADLQKELIEVYRIELDEKILAIADHLLQLEKNPPAPARKSLMEEIFRHAHSIKGASRGVGLGVVADLSHGMESLFAALKKQPQVPASDAIDAVLETLDFMRVAFEQFMQGVEPSAQKTKAINARLHAATEAVQRAFPDTTSQPPQTRPPSRLSNPRQPGTRWRPPVAPPRAVTSEDNDPPPAPDSPVTSPVETSPAQPTQAAALEPEPLSSMDSPSDETEAQRPATMTTETDVLHLSAEKLERLGAWTEEIHIALLDVINPWQKTRIIAEQADHLAQWMETLGPIPIHSRDAIKEIQSNCAALRHELTTSSRQLQQLTRSLQHEVLQMRQVKVATLTRPLTRMVRDLARELDKQVTLEIQGEHLIIDRVVLGLLRDPLNHLLRNALDHGIETPPERLSRNKPATGHIRLRFQQAGHRMQLCIQDDGAGMDAQEIGQAAIRKGIVDAESGKTLSREQLLNLIFRPGFSSREILTTISGRGIGLDVVQTNLRAMHGRVQVESTPGQGTTFTLDLPLTMATQRGLIIRVADQLLAIPTTQIDHILLVQPDMRVRVDNREAILLEQTPIPLVFLSDILGIDHHAPIPLSKPLPAVILSNGWRKVAFLVDDALEDREMVIKKLPPPLWSVPNIAGGTITGTGRVVIVLDPAALIESAFNHRSHSRFDSAQQAEPPIQKRILVVDDSITTRTLENNILTNAGYHVQLATNGLEAWELLQKHPFHLVVSDIQMPIMDGFQLTERIKTHDTLKETPVIIVSSLGSAKDQQRGVEVGADAYIIKGQFETKALLEVVEQLIV